MVGALSDGIIGSREVGWFNVPFLRELSPLLIYCHSIVNQITGSSGAGSHGGGGQGWMGRAVFISTLSYFSPISSTISLITLCLVFILEAKLTKQNCLRRLNYILTYTAVS